MINGRLVCRVFGLAVVLGGLACSGTRPRPRSSATPVESIVIAVERGHLRGRLVGAPGAPLLLLLHGGPGLSHDYLRPLEGLASAGFLVLSYDQRGCGASAVTSDAPITLDANIADIEVIRQRLGRDRIHILGHSWGGILGLAYAARFPSRVGSLVLVCSGPPTHAALLAGQGHLLRRVGALVARGVIPEQLPPTHGCDGAEQLRALLPVYFADPRRPLPPSLTRLSSNVCVNQKVSESFRGYDFTRDLDRLRVPVLITYGKLDPFGLDVAKVTAATIRQARLKLLPSCGHLPWIECPTDFFAVVQPFLAAVAADRDGSGLYR